MENQTARFTLGGKPTAMPRYYKRKIFDDYPDIKEIVNSQLADKVAELADAELVYASSYHQTKTKGQLKRKIYESKCEFNERFSELDNS